VAREEMLKKKAVWGASGLSDEIHIGEGEPVPGWSFAFGGWDHAVEQAVGA
jgi:hypothetical protein